MLTDFDTMLDACGFEMESRIGNIKRTQFQLHVVAQ